MKKKYCLLTNDVETHSIWLNKLTDETGFRVYNEVMPKLLDLYDEFNIKSTFFFTGYIAKLIPEIVRMVYIRGHEIGCHGLVHDNNMAFDILSFDEQVNHLKQAKKILEDISGEEVISFRAPALRVNKNTGQALLDSGFKIDSSISPQRLDFLFSFGSVEKVKRIFSPRKPYFANPNNLAFKKDSDLVEIPLSSFILPLVGSTMRAFPCINKVLRYALVKEAIFKKIPIVYYMHPNEFVNEDNYGSGFVERRTNNYFKYIIADKMRRNIKVRNLGDAGFNLYISQIEYFNSLGFSFITIRDYCILNNMLDL